MIDVIMCCYNAEKYIEEAVESVVNQTYKNFELTIVDDGSKDNTYKIVEDLINKYKENTIINLCSTPDVGLSMCRQFAINTTHGEYIVSLDPDDKIAPTFLEKTRNVLKENQEYAFVYSDTQLFDGSNGYWEQPEYNFFNLLNGNFICYCSLIRRSAFKAVDGYDLDNFGNWEDYELWLNLGRHGYYGKHLSEKLFYYRIRPDQATQSKRTQTFAPVYKAYIINKFPEIFPVELGKQARELLSKYPNNFISMNFKEQEKYL